MQKNFVTVRPFHKFEPDGWPPCDILPDPVLVVDGRGCCVAANAAACHVLGMDRDNLAQLSAKEFSSLVGEGAVASALADTGKGAAARFVIHLAKTPPVFLDVRTTRMYGSDEELSLWVCRDVTDREVPLRRYTSLSQLFSKVLAQGERLKRLEMIVEGLAAIFSFTGVGLWCAYPIGKGAARNGHKANGSMAPGKNDDGLKLVAQIGGLDSSGLVNVPRDQSLFSRILERGVVELHLSDMQDLPELLDWAQARAIEQGLCVRLGATHAEAEGVLLLFPSSPLDPLELDQLHWICIRMARLLQMTRIQEELLHAKEAIELLNSQKNQFSACLRREIQTAHNELQTLVELALKTRLTRQQREYLQAIKMNSGELARKVNDVFGFNHTDASPLNLFPTEFHLREEVESLIGLYRAPAEKKSLELILAIDPHLPDVFEADVNRVKQILGSLLDKALECTQQGELSLNIELAKTSKKTSEVSFRVHDTGTGCDPSTVGIFSPHPRNADECAHPRADRDLGLTTARQLLELMGGTIRIDSHPDLGTTCFMTLPLAMSTKRTVVAPRFPEIGSTLRFLVADDSQAALGSLQMLLDYLFACNPATAMTPDAVMRRLQEMAALGRPFDCVFLDSSLAASATPNVESFLARCCSLSPNGLTILGPAGHEEEWLRYRSLGVARFFSKPLVSAQLVELAREHGWLEQPDLTVADTVSLVWPELQGTRVLLVEDDPINSIATAGILELEGVQVSIAMDGFEALKMLRGTDVEYDLVIMDIQMPRMNGFEATRIIREDTRFRTLPIVAMTAYAQPDDRDHCMLSGMDDYLAKPIEPELLLGTLARVLKKHKQQAELLSAPDALHPAPVPPSPDSAESTRQVDLDIAEAGSMPVFDVADAMRRLRNNANLYQAMLVEFSQRYADGAGLETALAGKDLELLGRQAHTLKGSAANLSAMALAEAASTLLGAVRAGEHQDLNDLVALTEQALRQALAAIPSVL